MKRFRRLATVLAVSVAVGTAVPAASVRFLTDFRSDPLPESRSEALLAKACSEYGFADCSAVEIRVYDAEDPWFPKPGAKKGVSWFYPYGKDAVFVRWDRVFIEKDTLESEESTYGTFVHEYFHRVQSRTIHSKDALASMEAAFERAGNNYGEWFEGASCRAAESLYRTMSKMSRNGQEAVFEALSHGIEHAVSCGAVRKELVALWAISEIRPERREPMVSQRH